MPNLIDVKTLAVHLGLTEGGVRALYERRAIPHIKVSARCIRFDPVEVEKALAKRTVKAIG